MSQFLLQRIKDLEDRVAALERQTIDEMERQAAPVTDEQRRKPGRPKKDAAVAEH